MHPARKINLVLSFDYSLAQVLALVMSVWDIRILDFPGILVFPIDPFFLAVILKLLAEVIGCVKRISMGGSCSNFEVPGVWDHELFMRAWHCFY